MRKRYDNYAKRRVEEIQQEQRAHGIFYMLDRIAYPWPKCDICGDFTGSWHRLTELELCGDCHREYTRTMDALKVRVVLTGGFVRLPS